MIHNAYLEGEDVFIDSSVEFIKKIPENDKIIFLTSRDERYKDRTMESLNKREIRYDNIIFNAPFGERIIINDMKPSGLKMAYAVNVVRNEGLGSVTVSYDEKK